MYIYICIYLHTYIHISTLSRPLRCRWKAGACNGTIPYYDPDTLES